MEPAYDDSCDDLIGPLRHDERKSRVRGRVSRVAGEGGWLRKQADVSHNEERRAIKMLNKPHYSTTEAVPHETT